MRVCVIGNSGSGKSTLAQAIAVDSGLIHIELDSLFHQPNWEPTPTELFRSKVSNAQKTAIDQAGGWVCDGNYLSHLADMTVGLADVVVCFQFPRSRVMIQLFRRTLRRAIRREELWNGNRERIVNLFKLDPQLNILRWAWTQHTIYERKFAHLRAESRADWIEIRTAKQRKQVLAQVRATVSGQR